MEDYLWGSLMRYLVSFLHGKVVLRETILNFAEILKNGVVTILTLSLNHCFLKVPQIWSFPGSHLPFLLPSGNAVNEGKKLMSNWKFCLHYI